MNDFGSAFDQNMFDNLLGGGDSGAKQYEYKAVAIVDRYSRDLIHKLQSTYPKVRITFGQYHEKPANFLDDADLVLIECRLMEGFKDLKMISAIRQERPFIPIISISSNLDQEFMQAAFEAGVFDYVSSETSPEILHAKLRCIVRITDSSRHLELKNQEAVDSMKSMRRSKEKLKEEINNRLEAETQKEFANELAEIHQQNKEILDNLREAFFIVKKDLIIDETTSASCLSLFGQEIAGRQVGKALLLKQDKASFIEMNLEQLFDDFMPEHVTLQMIPHQVITESNRVLDLAYTVIHDEQKKPERVIIAASDVTETIRQKQLFQKQMHLFHSLFFILQNAESFGEFLADFKSDLAAMGETRQRETALRILHTIKGNAGVYTLDFLSKRVHSIETKIAKKRTGDAVFFDFMAKVAVDLEQQMVNFLVEHHKILGIEYGESRKDRYLISGSQLQDLSRLAEAGDKGSIEVLHKELLLLRFRPLSVLTSTLPNVVNRVIEKLEKKVIFSIHGDELRTNTDPLSPLFRSMVHLLNNACDHGIEHPDQRLELEKDPCGTLSLTMDADGQGGLDIAIKDDGRGIDSNKIRELALEKKLLSEANLNKLSEEEVNCLIFLDGFSTTTTVSQTSGRGVGMAAVKAEVEALKGTIHIETAVGKGTRFLINIPDVILLDRSSKAA